MDLFELIDEHTTVTIDTRHGFDSRSLITARDEATALRDELTEDGNEPTPEDIETARELTAIIEGVDAVESESGPDWQHGETFIAESNWVEYAQELAEDIGSVSRNAEWPYSHIDWQGAADALRMDYGEVEIDGATFLVSQ